MQGWEIKLLSVTSCSSSLSLHLHPPIPPRPPLPEMAQRVFTTKLRMCRGNNIFIRQKGWGKKAWLWIFIKMTYLFSNFSKVILLKVLSANFNYSLHWLEYRIHHVELIHSTRLFFSPSRSQIVEGGGGGVQSTNWIVMHCGLKCDLLITKTIWPSTIWWIKRLRDSVAGIKSSAYYK